jgi:hypothetical protein
MNNPVNRTDPSGLTPYTGRVTSPYRVLKKLGKGKSLQDLSDSHGGSTDGYVFTDKYGWVDIRHSARPPSERSRLSPDGALRASASPLRLNNGAPNDAKSTAVAFHRKTCRATLLEWLFGKSTCPGESLYDAFARWTAEAGARSPLDPAAGFGTCRPPTRPYVEVVDRNLVGRTALEAVTIILWGVGLVLLIPPVPSETGQSYSFFPRGIIAVACFIGSRWFAVRWRTHHVISTVLEAAIFILCGILLADRVRIH